MNQTLTDQIRQVLRAANGEALTVPIIMARLPAGTNIDTVGALLAQRKKAQEFVGVSVGTRLGYKLNPNRPPAPIAGKPHIAPPPEKTESPKIDQRQEAPVAEPVARLVKPAVAPAFTPKKTPARPEAKAAPKPEPPQINISELDRRIKRVRGMLEEMADAAQSTLDAMIDALPNAEAFRKALLARDQGREFMAMWNQK
ncbi:MAG: hypothetical protein ACTHMO_03830 [Rhodanobacteraceae bacterium]